MQVDIYAFGILLWELCTSQVPFAGMSPGQLVQAKLQAGSTRQLLAFPPSTPSVLKRLCRSCWHDNPARRHVASAAWCSFCTICILWNHAPGRHDFVAAGLSLQQEVSACLLDWRCMLSVAVIAPQLGIKVSLACK